MSLSHSGSGSSKLVPICLPTLYSIDAGLNLAPRIRVLRAMKGPFSATSSESAGLRSCPDR